MLISPWWLYYVFGFVTLKDKEFEIVKNLDIFYSLFNELNRFYVDETKPDKLIKSAIDGMLTSLDPYTTYIPEEDMDDFNFMTTGEYGGIGALIRKGGNYAMVSEPYENFPAQQAGLQAGDTILYHRRHIHQGKRNQCSQRNAERNTQYCPETADQTDRNKGNPGKNPDTAEKLPFPMFLIMDLFPVKSDISGLPILPRMPDLKPADALKALKEQGATSVILDLRGNPGGLLIESVNVSNLFIGKGTGNCQYPGKGKTMG